MSDEHLKKACKLLGVEVAQVLSWKEYPENDEIVLVVDHGIAGGKKYRLSLSSMKHEEPKPKEKIAVSSRKPVDDLDTLEDADLKALAQEFGVRNYWNMRRETLIKKLRPKLA